MAFISSLIREQFYRLGFIVGRHPIPFVVVPFLLSAVLTTGYLKFSYSSDIDELYVPTNGRFYQERQVIEKIFKMNKSSNFEASKITRLGKFGWILAYPRDRKTVLRETIMKELLIIDGLVRNISIIYNGETLFYRDVCAKNEGQCYRNEILALKNRIRDIEKRRSFVKYPLHFDKATWAFTFYAANIVNASLDDLGFITTASGALLMYFLNDDGEEALQRSYAWETAFLETMKDLSLQSLETHYFVSSSTEREVHRAVLLLIPYYIMLVLVMMGFCVLSNFSTDWIRSKPWLGVTSTLSALLAITGSTGLVMYNGVPFNDLITAVPFLLLGIGLDDSFVILAAWKRTDISKPVEERTAETFKEASVSITITSLTNFISFLLGLITPFPVVQIFCIYAASGIFFSYIYQILFFGATLAISGIAEEKRLHSIFCIRVREEWASDKTEGKSILCRLLFHSFATSSKGVKQDRVMKFFRDVIGHYLMKNWFRILILVTYIGYLAVAVWGCFHVIEGSGLELFVPYDSYAASFFVYFFKDFNQYRDRIQVIVPTPLNYADPTVRKDIEKLLRSFENSPFIAKGDLTESWLRYYTSFQRDAIAAFYLEKYNITTKQGYIDALRNVFFNYAPAKRFISDIVFNDNFTDIVASRFFVQTNRMGDFNEAKFVLVELRKIADRAPFPVYLSHFFFGFYDEFLCVGSVAMQTLLICGCVMLVLVTVFVPNVRCFVAAALNMISIEVGVIGYMAIWDVHIDTVSTIILITCVGFSVDYVAHMSTSYLGSSKVAVAEKLADALYAVGAAILQGSMSTVLGVMVILACNIYIFTCFVKIVFLFIVIAFYHSIFLLPMLFLFVDYAILTLRQPANRHKCLSKKASEYVFAPNLLPKDFENSSTREKRSYSPENC